jgi:uncharacterized protein
MSVMHGNFVWYELMTSDTKAAAAFYQAVIDWDAADSGMPGIHNYTMFSLKGGVHVAGLLDVPEDAKAMGARPGWIGYIAVNDVDAMAEEVKKAGGRIMRAPADIPGVGRFAVAADPAGAVFCLFHGEGEPPEMPPMSTPGLIAWRELHAGDGPSAFTFYSGLFGWRKGQAIDMGAMGVYQIYGKGDVDFGGIMTKSPEFPMPAWIYYINVPDIDGAVGKIGANGGTVINGPMEVPGGMWIAQGLDPQGAMFAVVGPKV